MTELKFRVWFIKGKTMSNVLGFKTELSSDILPDLIDLYLPDNITATNYVDEIELMQYAILPNRGKLEFCAGDIVEFTVFDHNDSDAQFQGVIVNTGSRFMIWKTPTSEYFGSDGGWDLDWVAAQDEEMKVIGNIHQDKHLLND